jgi:hypothetical protein
MPVCLTAAVRILRWIRRTAASVNLTERLAAAAAWQEPGPLLELRRRRSMDSSTSAAEPAAEDMPQEKGSAHDRVSHDRGRRDRGLLSGAARGRR